MKVLIAEDNPKMQSMLSSLLEKEGFETERAAGGKEALAKYREFSPDIICLDVMMDDLSGIDVCKEIRKADKKITIIMVTSKSSEADFAVGLEAGADAYVAKPYDLSDIAGKLRGSARRCIARDNPALYAEYFEFGDLKVYPGQLRAERGAGGMDLNFRDVNILRHFAANRSRVVPPEALKKFCWEGHPSAGELQLVQWHISQLRRKIEEDSDQPALIKSTPEGGYRYG
ncbi:MAG: response regulator transcription factor [Alphaproteobacteria bacterium]